MSESDAWSLPAIDRHDTPEKQAAAREAERRRQFAEAREQGYREGHAAGAGDARARADAFVALADALADPLADLDDDVEHALVELACRIARQVVRRELQTDRGAVLIVAREALAALPLNARNIRLTLHPMDAELVRESLSASEHSAKWTIEEDPLLTRGGVRVQSDRSLVDATVEKRLQNIVEALIDDERNVARDDAAS